MAIRSQHAPRPRFSISVLGLLGLSSLVCAQTASLSPTGLSFGRQLIATTSVPRVVTLSNTDSMTSLTINSISTSGDFAETNTCGGAVPPSGNCTISVTFSPTSAGRRTGSLTVNDNSTSGTIQVVSLAGTCVTVTVTPLFLSYSSQLIETMSSPKSVTLTNYDANPLAITSIISSGDFVQSNSCGNSISPGGSCMVSVTFVPTAAGKRSGKLSITDSAWNSPQVINLTGVGANPALVSLAVTPANRSVQIGQNRAFDAIGSFTDGSVANLTSSVIWGVTNGNVASLNSNVATGVDFGQTGITARSGTVTGTVTLTVSSVAVTPAVASITLTQTQQFQSNQPVTWAVDGVVGGNASSGTISATGLYTPSPVPGSHRIAATSQTDGTQGKASILVTDYALGTLTSSNDNFRTGQNLSETVLNPSNVTVHQFGKLFSLPVDGYVYAQPLYVENVNIPGQGQHNVVFAATEHDSVFAFDADGLTQRPLWQTSFIAPPLIVPVPRKNIPGGAIGPEQGITGTPVIDPNSGTLYVASRVINDGQYQYYLHALDIISGAEKFGGPVLIQASVSGTGIGSSNGTLSFNARYEHNRPGLLLMDGVLYIGFGALDQEGPTVPYHHGWILAYDSQSLQLLGAYSTTPDAWGASIWQSGGGLGGDGLGNVFAMTGNGVFDGGLLGSDYGFSFVKVALNDGNLGLEDWFAPYNWGGLLPDEDLGSGGPLLLPDQPGPYPHLIVGAGKSGVIYLLNRDDLGQISGGDAQIVQETPKVLAGIYSKPGYFNNQVWFIDGAKLFIFSLSNGLLVTPPLSKNVNIGYPGATPVVSANGARNGIVWFLGTHGQVVGHLPAVLYAYDPVRGSQLYSSSQAGSRDVAGAAVKFTVPTIANGKVYIGTQNTIDVFGLLPQ